MTTHSNILAVIIPWTKEPGGLQSMGSERVGHDWVTEHSTIQVSCMTFISARYLLHHCSARQERIMVIGNRPSIRWLSVSPICAYTAIKTYYLYVPVPSFIKQKSQLLHLHLKHAGGLLLRGLRGKHSLKVCPLKMVCFQIMWTQDVKKKHQVNW